MSADRLESLQRQHRAQFLRLRVIQLRLERLAHETLALQQEIVELAKPDHSCALSRESAFQPDDPFQPGSDPSQPARHVKRAA